MKKLLALVGKTIVVTITVVVTLIAASAAVAVIAHPHVETHQTTVYEMPHDNT